MSARDTQRVLIAFFEQVARRDKEHLRRLKDEMTFTVDDGRWCFTLPALHSFLQHYDEVFAGLSYSEFRRLLYNSPINETLKETGAEIIISENVSNVDRSVYALVWPPG